MAEAKRKRFTVKIIKKHRCSLDLTRLQPAEVFQLVRLQRWCRIRINRDSRAYLSVPFGFSTGSANPTAPKPLHLSGSHTDSFIWRSLHVTGYGLRQGWSAMLAAAGSPMPEPTLYPDLDSDRREHTAHTLDTERVERIGITRATLR